MKKVIIVALLAVLFCVGIFAEAESTISDKLRESFMKVDLDYLIAYRDTINDIIVERGGEAKISSSDNPIQDEAQDETPNEIQGEPFSEGVYEAGKTIKPGIYKIDVYDYNIGVMLDVYESREMYNEKKKKEHYIAVSKGDVSYIITLEEGNILSLSLAGGRGDITISTAKASWMP